MIPSTLALYFYFLVLRDWLRVVEQQTFRFSLGRFGICDLCFKLSDLVYYNTFVVASSLFSNMLNCRHHQEAHRWRTGRGHPHTGLLGAANLADPTGITDTFSTGSMPPSVYPKWTVPQTDKNPSGEPDRQQAGAPFHNHNNTSARPSATSTTRDAAAIGPAVFPFPPATPAATASTKDKHWPHSRQGGEGTGSRQTGATFAGLRDFKHPTVPQGWVLAGAASGLGVGSAGTGARSPTRVGTAPSLGETRRGLKCSGGDCTAQQSTGERLLGGRAKVRVSAPLRTI